jgi:AbiV family abortive infection protein
MSSSTTPQFLLEGAAHSLAQCGLLLRDADMLYRSGSYPNAVVLTAFAWEALGQWMILLDLRRQVLGGENIPISKLKTLYDDHVLRQAAGMLSIQMIGDREMGVGKLIMSRMMSVPGSAEWKRTDEALQQLHKIKAKRVPQDRHNLRKLAMYVDPIDNRWNIPSTRISRADARDFIQEARNDYAVQCLNRYNDFEVLRDIDQELCTALEQWTDRPTLLLPPDVSGY